MQIEWPYKGVLKNRELVGANSLTRTFNQEGHIASDEGGGLLTFDVLATSPSHRNMGFGNGKFELKWRAG